MEISQRNWNYWFRRTTVSANDEGIKYSTRSMLDDYDVNYEYKELMPNPLRGRVGIRAYAPIGWWVLMIGASVSTIYYLGIMLEIFAFPDSINRLMLNFSTITLLISLLLFATRLIKIDMVWFLTKSESTAFSFNVNKKNRQEVEEIVSFIEKKALEAQEN